MTDHLRPEDLYLYLEGELGAFDAEHLEEHVDACPGCRAALDERRLLHEAFTSLPPFEVPHGFAAAVMERLPGEARRSGWLGSLIAGTAALAAGLIGFSLFTGAGLADLLAALNGVLGAAAAQVVPLAVKTFKLGGVLATVVGSLLNVGLQGLATFIRILGPAGAVAAVGLILLAVSLLVLLGARRFLHQGEQP